MPISQIKHNDEVIMQIIASLLINHNTIIITANVFSVLTLCLWMKHKNDNAFYICQMTSHIPIINIFVLCQ